MIKDKQNIIDRVIEMSFWIVDDKPEVVEELKKGEIGNMRYILIIKTEEYEKITNAWLVEKDESNKKILIMDNELLWKEFCLDKINSTWIPFFRQESKNDYFFPLLTKLEEEYKSHKCWPKKENIFRLFREISLEKIKVVILGQDPYHLPGVADGIAFSTQKPNYIPASLRNIFLEFSKDLDCSPPRKGDLLPWVKEGVFLLNAALTVRDGQALSHMSRWKEFLYSLLTYLKECHEKLIWVFWGQKARKIGEECQISSDYSLFSTHPSPYSAEHGFFGSRPFSKANKLLSALGKEPVNWLSILNRI